MTLRIISLVFLLTLTCFGLCPLNVKCPIDDSGAYFTGKTQVISGHLVGTFHCVRGHDILVRCD